MFTGIVEEVGKVKYSGQGKLVVSARKVLEGTVLGDSIATNGVCLTVTELTADSFSVDVMPETLRRSSLGSLRSGDPVNLERALAAGGRMGGHFVQGHVDGTGKIVSFTPEGDAVLMKISAPPKIMRYVVEKGFIAIEGISLTVTSCDESAFSVSLVSFSRANTNLSAKKPGDAVNLEVDIIAKYVERLTGSAKQGITSDFLSEHGFI